MERNKSLAKRNKLLLLVGFAFFINPVPLGLDLIPDAFGCLLVFFGLTQLAFFDGAVETARKNVFYLFVVEAVKLLMMKSVFMTEISTNRMLAVTVFALLEGYLYVVFLRNLFGGITYFSMRNNCNQTLAKIDGCVFMTYMSFFVRLFAMLLPELVAIIELRVEVVTDFDTIDKILAIVDAKPVFVVLLSVIALVAGVTWFVSFAGFVKVFYSESYEVLDSRYIAEYISEPEKVIPQKLKNWSYVAYGALFFTLNIAFDGIRIIPMSATFLLLFVGGFMMKPLGIAAKPRYLCLVAAVLFAVAEVFQKLYVPYGAIAINETKLWIVLVGSVIGVAASVVALACVRIFLADVRNVADTLGSKDIYTFFPWITFCIMIALWAVGYSVPYLYNYISTIRLIFAILFIYQTSKIIVLINDEEWERTSLNIPKYH